MEVNDGKTKTEANILYKKYIKETGVQRVKALGAIQVLRNAMGVGTGWVSNFQKKNALCNN